MTKVFEAINELFHHLFRTIAIQPLFNVKLSFISIELRVIYGLAEGHKLNQD